MRRTPGRIDELITVAAESRPDAIHLILTDGSFARYADTAVRAWGLELCCLDPQEYSSCTTAVVMPEGRDEAQFRRAVLEQFDLSLGAGLSKLAGRVFRIGHLGWFNDLMLCGALCGVEMGLRKCGIPFNPGGVDAAMACLSK